VGCAFGCFLRSLGQRSGADSLGELSFFKFFKFFKFSKFFKFGGQGSLGEV
jgi:hypothetical protein